MKRCTEKAKSRGIGEKDKNETRDIFRMAKGGGKLNRLDGRLRCRGNSGGRGRIPPYEIRKKRGTTGSGKLKTQNLLEKKGTGGIPPLIKWGDIGYHI